MVKEFGKSGTPPPGNQERPYEKIKKKGVSLNRLVTVQEADAGKKIYFYMENRFKTKSAVTETPALPAFMLPLIQRPRMILCMKQLVAFFR
jgi:hypothetical protein